MLRGAFCLGSPYQKLQLLAADQTAWLPLQQRRCRSVTPSSEPETWRQLLALRISDLDERRRIAQLAGVDEVTLKRYAEGKTKRIRPHLLRPLVAAWPSGERPLLTRLIREEYPDFVVSEQPDTASLNGINAPEAPAAIPLEVYERVLRAYATT